MSEVQTAAAKPVELNPHVKQRSASNETIGSVAAAFEKVSSLLSNLPIRRPSRTHLHDIPPDQASQQFSG